ncbi:alpha--amylase-like protein [Lineolata rhizophorae]|uniref:Alpha--amylase-like protein n=1 Tax=Lineolata rhizophorae TaxID=578093 RepID=A0A6A6PDD4_9PEZI|nr:alpha--amylase-like protein [Lineolata rhizophorae]
MSDSTRRPSFRDLRQYLSSRFFSPNASSASLAKQNERLPTPRNSTLFQAFEWNVPPDGRHWSRLRDALPALARLGTDNIWLPPGCKASNVVGNGYDIYDLYDLGEFEQKWTRRTKWGTKEELLELGMRAEELGVRLMWDAVLNHKAGADHTEKCRAVEVDENDRTKVVSKPREIEAWLQFDFYGRGDTYSKLKHHCYHFNGTDYDNSTGHKAIYRLEGKSWSNAVDRTKGNDDFLMFANLDYSNVEVVEDVRAWGAWILDQVPALKGFRLDAVQHFSGFFTRDWVDHVRNNCGNDVFVVGEFWDGDTKKLLRWLDMVQYKISLFDVALLNNFSHISTSEDADLRKILDATLVQARPKNAVTVVMNHDTQPGQTMDTKVLNFFKPLAYAFILLRRDGYPCVFYGDLYGTRGKHAETPSCGGKLPDLILARTLYAYGEQQDYFDNRNCVGWVRQGTWDRPFGLAVVISNFLQTAALGVKRMYVGVSHAGEVWTDMLGWSKGEVAIDNKGWGKFTCASASVGVWVNKEAAGRELFPVDFDTDIYREASPVKQQPHLL